MAQFTPIFGILTEIFKLSLSSFLSSYFIRQSLKYFVLLEKNQAPSERFPESAQLSVSVSKFFILFLETTHSGLCWLMMMKVMMTGSQTQLWTSFSNCWLCCATLTGEAKESWVAFNMMRAIKECCDSQAIITCEINSQDLPPWFSRGE